MRMGKIDPSENILILILGFTVWANVYFPVQTQVARGNFDLARAVRAVKKQI